MCKGKDKRDMIRVNFQQNKPRKITIVTFPPFSQPSFSTLWGFTKKGRFFSDKQHQQEKNIKKGD